MADKVTRQVSGKPVNKDDVEVALNREVIPTLRQMVDVHNKSQGLPTVVTSETYVTTQNQYWLADATGGAFDIYLPSTDQWAMRVYIKKIDPGVNMVTIYPESPDTIEGSVKLELLDTFSHAELWAHEGTWYLAANTGVLRGGFSSAFSTAFDT